MEPTVRINMFWEPKVPLLKAYLTVAESLRSQLTESLRFRSLIYYLSREPKALLATITPSLHTSFVINQFS
jgi:hypothetical protein